MAEQKQDEQLNINLNPNQTPILFTDIVFMDVNEDGLILDICQKIGPTNQVHVVARIGMSREHAKKFTKKMTELLALTEGKSQTGEKN